MAQRRMFSKQITDSDSFLSMSLSAQALYFHLGMQADDDGFTPVVRISKMLGTSQDDVAQLFVRKFLLQVDTGVIVIRDWRVNNEIRRDRYSETMFTEQKSMLVLNEKNQYDIAGKPLVLPDDNQMATQVRLGKVRLGKEKYMSAKADAFDAFWEAYPKKELKKKAVDIWKRKNYSQHIEEILAFIEKAKQTDRWAKGYIKQPTTFLNNESWNDDLTAYSDVRGEALEIKRY